MSSEIEQDPSSPNSSDLLNLPEFREMKMRAEAAEARLRRIYNTPFWRFSKPLRKIYAQIWQRLITNRESNYVFKADSSEGTPVTSLVEGKVICEISNANVNAPSIALIAHFSKDLKVTESLERYIDAILKNGFQVILISATEIEGHLKISESLKNKITIIRKPNLGYDFGSWATALEYFPEVLSADEILLTNDSLIGPLDDISNLFFELRNSKFDITGITDSSQLQYHIQSYVVHMNKRAIQNLNLINFLKSVVHLGMKNDVILKYELGLTRTAQLSGLYVGSIFPWNLVTGLEKNPSLAGWSRLLDLGFPFLKKEAIRLGKHGEIKQMKNKLKEKFKNSDFAIEEIDSIS